ncbi:MAG TPA: hypothetical protein PKL26_08300, partial [Methanolinea sp.]|nr:hypothetical protein [Methanolinea sp.]
MSPPAPCDFMQSLDEYLRDHIPELVALYRDLHAHPELSGQEARTSTVIATEMGSAGFRVTR